ncbi:MAG: ornithine carbamoyltransferase [Acidobacteria bacterium]|nr:ornithine carbamoyltransferase [Acidobacteriota bacterium]
MKRRRSQVSAPVAVAAIRRTQAGNFTRDLDLTRDELLYLLDLTAQVKKTPGRYARELAGQYLSLLFEKPSLRTRLTFELAIKQLGGDSILNVGPVGEREPIKDVARNLDRWTNAIVARTFLQKTVDELARWSKVPVINALSDLYHPCQALADVFTLREHFGELPGLRLAFVGDGNNVAHSLMLCSARLGIHFAVASPGEYEPNPEIVAEARALAAQTGASLLVTDDPDRAVAGAHAVYTDVWASMGQEAEAETRRRVFRRYQVNETLLSKARTEAVFMHCLPAKRDQETTDSVMETTQSVVFDQAENRLHTQKALLLMLMAH